MASFSKILGLTALMLSVVGIAEESATYSPISKRDPFRAPDLTGVSAEEALGPLERFSISQFKLRAIVRSTGRPMAMFQDPDGSVHILGEGDRIGKERGMISRILNREVIVTERTKNYLGEERPFERVLSLPVDELEQDSEGASSAPARRATSVSGPTPTSSNISRQNRAAPSTRSSSPSRSRNSGNARVRSGEQRAPTVNRNSGGGTTLKGTGTGLSF